MSDPKAQGPILSVQGLTTEFRVAGAWHAALRDVSFDLRANETLALVGESGCGKSMTALSVMGLVPKPAGRIAAGRIMFEGRDLAALQDEEMRAVRGDRIAMIFQEPMTSLNPVLTVGDQVGEALRVHRDIGRDEARARALELLDQVKIPSARQRLDDYPHQFSGGMRQRVMIAMALACKPSILLADEPTTALDVTIQAQVLSLLAELKQAYGMAVVFITHNLGVVATIADRVAVMYAGEVVETAPVGALFDRPTHPYTEALLRSIPRVDRQTESLAVIPGQVPPISRMPAGCRYAPRCGLRAPGCERPPVLAPLARTGAGYDAHRARCWVRAGDATGAGVMEAAHG